MNREEVQDIMGYTRTISADQVAILADRVDTLIGNYSKIEGLILAMATQQNMTAQQLAVFQERLAQNGENQVRAGALAKDHGILLDEHLDRIETLAKQVVVHSWSWKLFGAVAVLSLSLVGWTFSELQRLNTTISQQRTEIKMLDFMVNRNASVYNYTPPPAAGVVTKP